MKTITRHPILVGLSPNGFALRLDPFACTKHDDSTIKHAQHRSTSARKSTWPGVSSKLIVHSFHRKVTQAAKIVMPRCCSSGSSSVSVVPESTAPARCLAPLINSICSVTVVFPASMWAMMPMLRIFVSSRAMGMIKCSIKLQLPIRSSFFNVLPKSLLWVGRFHSRPHRCFAPKMPEKMEKPIAVFEFSSLRRTFRFPLVNVFVSGALLLVNSAISFALYSSLRGSVPGLDTYPRHGSSSFLLCRDLLMIEWALWDWLRGLLWHR